jgi:hypothetical protein
MNFRVAIAVVLLALPMLGCDGKDPERLNRVGKKIVEKSRRLAEDSDLPKITVTMPEHEKAVVEGQKDKEAAAAVPGQGDRKPMTSETNRNHETGRGATLGKP